MEAIQNKKINIILVPKSQKNKNVDIVQTIFRQQFVYNIF